MEVELLANNHIKVYTPIPYIVDSYEHAEKEKIEEVMHSLKQSVLFLRNCLKLLDISEQEAREKEYTLNWHTGDILKRLAYHKKNLSHEFKMSINRYNW